MKFSKATNYALYSTLFLAMDISNKLFGVQELAEKQNVSLTYLSKIYVKLAKGRIIISSSGVNGGYSINRKLEENSFLDIIHAIEGKLSLFDCCLDSLSECTFKKIMLSAEK